MSFLTVNGQQFLYNGTAVRLRGMNFNNETGLIIAGASDITKIDANAADYAKVSSWGGNSIRWGMDYFWWSSNPTQFYTVVDQHIAWAKANRLWIYPVLYIAPDYTTGQFDIPGQAAFWASSSDQTAVVNFWIDFATHYASEPTIAGYDFLNEPSPGDGWPNTQWTNFAQRIYNAVAAVDTNHFAVVGAALSNAIPTLTGSRVAYSVHHYGTGDNYPGPSGTVWSTNNPLIVGEFGGMLQDGSTAVTWVNSHIHRYETDHVHWTHFVMHEQGPTRFGLYNNWNAGDFTSPWTAMINVVAPPMVGSIQPDTASGSPLLTMTPAALSFSAVAGGSSPTTQHVTLAETAGFGTDWTSTISYGAGSGWLTMSLSSGTLAASGTQIITVTAITSGLAAGVYTASITCTATTGGATATTTVTFTVNAVPPSGGYSNYKNAIEPNLVAALAAKNLFNFVQLIGPDTTMASDSWLTSAATDLASTLSGYTRHAFPSEATDISGGSLEGAAKSLVASIYAHDATAKPVIAAEMGDAALGPGQAVTTYQYGVEMADYAVQLARAGLAACVAYLLDDDMHDTQWGLWQISQEESGQAYGAGLYGLELYGLGILTDSGVPRPWFFPWSVLTRALTPGSTIYAPVQPTSNDARVLVAQSAQGGWTIVLVNRRVSAQAMRVSVPFAKSVSTPLNVYSYTDSAPLFVDTSGFPLAAGTLQVVLSRGFTVSVAANSVLILTQATTVETNLFDVKRPPLQKRR